MSAVTALFTRTADRARDVVGLLAGTDEMSNADRERWAQARSLADVGELTARWLEGDVQALPTYRVPCDVDEHLAPGMTDTLVALNRAGMVTHQSQGGHADDDYQQQAAVSGYAEPALADRIRETTAGEPNLVVADLADRDQRRQAPVGWHASPRELRDDWTGYGICHPDAVAELVAAEQVCVYDREPGRNDRLWPALQAAADQRVAEAAAIQDDDAVDEW